MSALINNPASERWGCQRNKRKHKASKRGQRKNFNDGDSNGGRVGGWVGDGKGIVYGEGMERIVCVSRINALGRVTNDTDGGHGGAQINDLLRL